MQKRQRRGRLGDLQSFSWFGHAIPEAGVDFGGVGVGSSQCEPDVGSIRAILGNRDVLGALRVHGVEMGLEESVEACDRAETTQDLWQIPHDTSMQSRRGSSARRLVNAQC